MITDGYDQFYLRALLRCSCGALMVTVTEATPDGGRIRYYRCAGRCRRNIDAVTTETAVWDRAVRLHPDLTGLTVPAPARRVVLRTVLYYAHLGVGSTFRLHWRPTPPRPPAQPRTHRLPQPSRNGTWQITHTSDRHTRQHFSTTATTTMDIRLRGRVRPARTRLLPLIERLGTCRWCLDVIVVRSTGWIHLTNRQTHCPAPPNGAPLTVEAQPLPPAPHRWDLLFIADVGKPRILWPLDVIAHATEPHLDDEP